MVVNDWLLLLLLHTMHVTVRESEIVELVRLFTVAIFDCVSDITGKELGGLRKDRGHFTTLLYRASVLHFFNMK